MKTLSAKCSHTYRRASVHGAYTLSVARTYTVKYMVDGAEQQIEDAPEEFTAPADTVPLVVREIQTTVTGDR
jgi:hypothetical protein